MIENTRCENHLDWVQERVVVHGLVATLIDASVYFRKIENTLRLNDFE